MDPFSMLFDAFWEMAEASVPLMELVKEGNRIKFNTSDRDPIKSEIAAADLPELVLSTEGSTEVNLHRTSCSTSIQRQYSWIIATGDKRVKAYLYPVEFALMCAMANWKNTIGALTWQGQDFVKSAQLIGVTEGQSDPNANRGIMGWSTIWRCQVDMHFTTASLLAYNNGE